MSNTLYISNVSETADEKSLQKEFSACGGVVAVTIVKDRATGAHKGYAFVEMASADDAQKAIKALNGKAVAGNELAVSIAKPNGAQGKRGAGPANRGPEGHPGVAGGRGNRW